MILSADVLLSIYLSSLYITLQLEELYKRPYSWLFMLDSGWCAVGMVFRFPNRELERRTWRCWRCCVRSGSTSVRMERSIRRSLRSSTSLQWDRSYRKWSDPLERSVYLTRPNLFHAFKTDSWIVIRFFHFWCLQHSHHCIVCEHLYSASHIIEPYRSVFSAPRKQTGVEKR